MAGVKWIKLSTNMFDNSKIKYLRTLPEGNNIVLIWVMLLAKAGKCNSHGFIFLTENIPYTAGMLGAEFGFDENLINLALNSLAKLGLIQLEEQKILITSWEEHQNVDGLDKIREQTRKRVEKHRNKKQLQESNASSNVTVTEDNATDIEEDIEEDIDICNISKDILCTTTVERIIKIWNRLGLTAQLKSINKGTQRYKMLKARIKQYSLEDIFRAIEEVSKSKFLKGQANNFEVSFDWFIKPNNFQKILEGNYRDKDKKVEKNMGGGFDFNDY